MLPLLAVGYLAVKGIDLAVNAPKRNRELRSQGNVQWQNLLPGDVLLKLSDDSFLNDFTGVAQIASSNSHFVHAAIAGTVPDHVIEMDGSGVVESDLKTKNRNISYMVYRPRSSMIVRRTAGLIAEQLLMIHETRGTLGYTTSGALVSLGKAGVAPSTASLRKLLAEIRGGKKYNMFCSEFVILCYQFAAAELGEDHSIYFPTAAALNNPSFMATQMKSNGLWEPLGALKKGVR